jgi:Protein of unknown function (DUF1648)
MNRKLYPLLVWLTWLALPLTALRFWLVWDQLPLRMATHFNANWQPNGWMSREVALEFALGVTAIMLVVFTIILLIIRRQKAAGAFVWAMLAFSYAMIGFIFVINGRIVSYNLTGQQESSNFLLPLPFVAVIALIPIYLYSTRSQPLPPSDLVADEVHDSPVFALVMIAITAFMLYIFSTLGEEAARAIPMLISLLLLAAAAAAWSGFHYVFTRHGLEIKTLGFRLRSVPVDQIQNYAPGSWNILRGYGIRGAGNSRAYVWGNSGVQLSTSQGQIFLGHNDPERIVRDLDMITQNRKGPG